MHNIAEHLVNGESILHLMGYLPQEESGGGCYKLPGSIIDVDVVSRLALDCHIACSECQVIIYTASNSCYFFAFAGVSPTPAKVTNILPSEPIGVS